MAKEKTKNPIVDFLFISMLQVVKKNTELKITWLKQILQKWNKMEFVR